MGRGSGDVGMRMVLDRAVVSRAGSWTQFHGLETSSAWRFPKSVLERCDWIFREGALRRVCGPRRRGWRRYGDLLEQQPTGWLRSEAGAFSQYQTGRVFAFGTSRPSFWGFNASRRRFIPCGLSYKADHSRSGSQGVRSPELGVDSTPCPSAGCSKVLERGVIDFGSAFSKFAGLCLHA